MPAGPCAYCSTYAVHAMWPLNVKDLTQRKSRPLLANSSCRNSLHTTVLSRITVVFINDERRNCSKEYTWLRGYLGLYSLTAVHLRAGIDGQ